MALNIAIVGLPNVGKSTIFNVLTGTKGANAENYPFCTIDPNVGVVEVPDERLEKLTEISKPEKVIPSVIEFVDIAGLVKGASQGEGLGNQFLAHIRECDAVAQVVRCFEDGNVTHVSGKIDPKEDLEIIMTELIIADLQSMEKRRHRVEKASKSGDKEMKKELEMILKYIEALEGGKLASTIELSDDEVEIAQSFFLLTHKPFIYIANIGENDLASFNIDEMKAKMSLGESDVLVPISAKLEEDLSEFSLQEKKDYLKELGIDRTGLDNFIQAAYKSLNLISYFTAGEKEVRAWTIKEGTKAPGAAGVIHTDFEKGFICAETIACKDFIECNGEAGAKEKGVMKRQGKEYTVQDGDVMHFRFNV